MKHTLGHRPQHAYVMLTSRLGCAMDPGKVPGSLSRCLQGFKKCRFRADIVKVLGLTKWANYRGLWAFVKGLYGDTAWTYEVN